MVVPEPGPIVGGSVGGGGMVGGPGGAEVGEPGGGPLPGSHEAQTLVPWQT